MDNWMKFHYEGQEEEIERTARKLHGRKATVEVGHKGGISVYEPAEDTTNARTRIAYHPSFEAMREAAQAKRRA